MNRWRKLTPRIVVAAALALGFLVFSNPLLKFYLARHCQSISGLEASFRSVRADWNSGKLQLDRVAFYDPSNPKLPLLQADTATLNLDPSAAWRRELVVTDGVVRNLQINTTPTCTDGKSDSKHSAQAPLRWSKQDWQANWEDTQKEIAAALRPHSDPSAELAHNLRKTAAEVRGRWPAECCDQKRLAETVHVRLANFKAALEKQPLGNPLRGADGHPNYAEQLQTIESEMDQVHHSLDQLREQLIADRQRLADAKAADAQIIQQPATDHPIEATSLARILVGPAQCDRIDDSLAWVQWIRSLTGLAAHGDRMRPGAGVDVQFVAGGRPKFLIRSLELDAVGSFAHQSFAMAGIVRNYAWPARLSLEPCVIEIQSSDDSLIVRGEIDRRGHATTEHLTLVANDLCLPAHVLGGDGLFSIAVGPGRLSAHVDIRIRGDSVDGTVTLNQTETALRILEKESKPLSPQFVEALNGELRASTSFSTVVRLSGGGDSIAAHLESSLGPMLERIVARCVMENRQAAAQAQLAALEQQYSAELVQLNQDSQRGLEELSDLLQSGVTRIAQLEQFIPTASGLQRMR